ncbi:hypothetical protein AURDEDRAFT_173570 [Auricularia subglabra TFB-10046 SS5]|nr:hypothetical protein AURDEDRAFT_173570 [Auricularia subglabra TFB-10046 SS5]
MYPPLHSGPGHSESSSSSGSYSGHSTSSSLSPTELRFAIDPFTLVPSSSKPDSMLYPASQNAFGGLNSAPPLDHSFLLQQITDITRERDILRASLEQRATAYHELLQELQKLQAHAELTPAFVPTPDKDDYLDVLNWSGADDNCTDGRFGFVIDADGNFVGSERTSLISETGKLCFQELHRRQLLERTWGANGILVVVLFVNAMEKMFPELSYCADHWKAKTLARLIFPDWVSRRGKELTQGDAGKKRKKTTTSDEGGSDERPSKQAKQQALLPPPTQPGTAARPAVDTAQAARNVQALQVLQTRPNSKPPALKLSRPAPRAAATQATSSQAGLSGAVTAPGSEQPADAQHPAPPAGQDDTASSSAAAPTPGASQSLELDPGAAAARAPPPPPSSALPDAPRAPQTGTDTSTNATTGSAKQFRLYKNSKAPDHILRCEWAAGKFREELTTPNWEAYLHSPAGKQALAVVRSRTAVA